jgi:NAD(P)-dependent dehydrogenase (short-subunit alcohol dehydrogenase family)
MSTTLDGRVALVTGGSRGVGRAISLRLARQGATVAVNYRRDQAAALEVVDEIRAGGGTASAYQASVGDAEAVLAMVDAVRADLGGVSIVVSNAGVASGGASAADTPISEFAKLMQVHAFGAIELIRAVLPDLRAGERGDVVVISSNTVAFTPAGAAPYTMAKGAMEIFTRTIAREERVNGVHANIVAPGLIATEMGRRLVQAAKNLSIEELDADSPFGRVCRPEDVAGAVAYLVSSDAGYLTGQTLYVDGGGAPPAVF